MYVEYEGIDEAMRTGHVLDYHPWNNVLDPDWLRGPTGLTYRRADQKRLHQHNAHGWIDDMAAAVATAAAGGLRSVLKQLANEYETTFTLPSTGAPMFAKLFWKDGTIKAEISMAGKVDWLQTTFELKGGSVPETVASSLEGRTLEALVELPFVCRSKITEVQIREKGLRVELDVGKRLVNLSTGKIWEAPFKDE